MIDTSGMAFPKHAPPRDRKHLAFVREQACAVIGNSCGGVTEAAHIGVEGRGLKSSDFFTIPLCTLHHRESHDAGIITFQLNHAINIWEVCARLLARRMGSES